MDVTKHTRIMCISALTFILVTLTPNIAAGSEYQQNAYVISSVGKFKNSDILRLLKQYYPNFSWTSYGSGWNGVTTSNQHQELYQESYPESYPRSNSGSNEEPYPESNLGSNEDSNEESYPESNLGSNEDSNEESYPGSNEDSNEESYPGSYPGSNAESYPESNPESDQGYYPESNSDWGSESIRLWDSEMGWEGQGGHKNDDVSNYGQIRSDSNQESYPGSNEDSNEESYPGSYPGSNAESYPESNPESDQGYYPESNSDWGSESIRLWDSEMGWEGQGGHKNDDVSNYGQIRSDSNQESYPGSNEDSNEESYPGSYPGSNAESYPESNPESDQGYYPESNSDWGSESIRLWDSEMGWEGQGGHKNDDVSNYGQIRSDSNQESYPGSNEDSNEESYPGSYPGSNAESYPESNPESDQGYYPESNSDWGSESIRLWDSEMGWEGQGGHKNDDVSNYESGANRLYSNNAGAPNKDKANCSNGNQMAVLSGASRPYGNPVPAESRAGNVPYYRKQEDLPMWLEFKKSLGPNAYFVYDDAGYIVGIRLRKPEPEAAFPEYRIAPQLRGDQDQCCATVELFYRNTSLIDVTNIRRPILQSTYRVQFIRHGVCGVRGFCRGRCVQTYINLCLFTTLGNSCTFFQVPGYCACKNFG